MKKLTPRQKRLAQYIATGLTIRESMVKAGYSDTKNTGRNATRLMVDPLFKTEVKRLQKASDDRTILTLKKARQILTEIATGADSSSSIKIKSIDQLSKLSAWEVQQINLNITKNAEELSDEELAKIASGK